MAGDLFRRLVAKFKAGKQAAGFRALAVNGNDAARKRLVKERHLDQKTLELLARRGPRAARVGVANHPCLTLETARRLLRIDDCAFQEALQRRFGEEFAKSLPNSELAEAFRQAPLGEVISAMPTVEVTREASPSATPTSNSDPTDDSYSSAPLEPFASDAEWDAEHTQKYGGREGVAHSPSDCGPEKGGELSRTLASLEAPGDKEPRGQRQEVGGSSDTRPEAAELQQGDTTELDVDPSVLDLAFELIGSLPRPNDSAETRTWDPGQREFDDAVELKLIEIFKRTPSGRAGEELLARLAGRRGAPQLRFLIHLRDSGWDIDQICLIWRVRDIWNDSHEVGRYESPLDYWTVAQLVSVFFGVPEEEEVLNVLELLATRWKRESRNRQTSLNDYIRQWVTGYVAAWRSGGRPPIDFLLQG